MITLLTTTIYTGWKRFLKPRERPRSRSPSTPNKYVVFYFITTKILLFLPLLFFASGDENGGKKERIFSRRICGLNTDFIHIIIYIYYPKQTNEQTESGRRSHRYGWRRGHVNFDARWPVWRDDGCRRHHRFGAGQTRFARARIRRHDQRVHVHWSAL